MITRSMASISDSQGSKLVTISDTALPIAHSATRKVFSTTELLCNIAAHLPPKDIFTAGSVCRNWRSALAADPVI
jgi:hypothetical protein